MEKPLSDTEVKLLALVREFIAELEVERSHRIVTLESFLEKDLAIDSLGKAELIHRIEKTFSVQLPEKTIVEAQTVRDFLAAIEKAHSPEKIAVRVPSSFAVGKTFNLSSKKTLVDILMHYVREDPNRHHIYLQDDHGGEQIIFYGELFDKAAAIAAGLQERGLQLHETVAIMLPTSASFFYVFFGVLLAGGIPVPIYPPLSSRQIEEYVKREAGILRNAEIKTLITFQEAALLSKVLRPFVPSLKEITTVDVLMKTSNTVSAVSSQPDDLALIQYTSGSTGNPKGVALTHQNLLANIRAMGHAINVTPKDMVVSWLPLYHDMGLIGTWLSAFYYGNPIVILSPLSFLLRPERWLWSIHSHRATISGAPNFAYELCINKIDDAAIVGLDLSSWRLAFNGAEAIYPGTLRRFTEKFSPYGFKAEAFFPVYGLAETSVGLTFPPINRKPLFDKVSREIFEKEQRAVPAQKEFIEFVACGKAFPKHEVRIVNDVNQVLEERTIGHLQFKGPSVMRQYYRNPVATQAVYHEGWWDSGDLAYKANGEFFITGRKKDIIIKAGRNLYPEGVEEVVSQVAGVRKGCVVALGMNDPRRGTEKFVILAETRETKTSVRQRIMNSITEKVTTTLGVPPDQVFLLSPKVLPKTSSGKLQRSAAKKAYLQGRLVRRRLPIWLQVAKLSLYGFFTKMRRTLNLVGKIIYTFYTVIVICVLGLPAWFCVAVFSPKTAGKVLRLSVRLLFKLVVCPISIEGGVDFKETGPLLIVSNHMSYIDSVVLMAVLPPDISFVAKQELLKAPVFGTFIKKLNYATVDRMDFSHSEKEVVQIARLLEQGRSVVIYPEGTFGYPTALRPFKFGAFKIAVNTKTPVCPVAIQGTRRVGWSHTVWLRPGRIRVSLGELIIPKGDDWHEVVRLQSLARAEIEKKYLE